MRPPGGSMIGIVLVTHGRLAIEFRAALEHVVGAQEQIETVTIGPDDNVEQRRRDIIEAVKKVDSGDGVVILTDMFGGTPSNLAISVMSRPKVEVLAGINLPMLIKLVKVRDECPLAEAVAAAQESGRKYITIASRVLAGKSAAGPNPGRTALPIFRPPPRRRSSSTCPSSISAACMPAPPPNSSRPWRNSMPT